MRVSTGALITLSLFSAAGLHAQDLREDSFKWFVGAQGGVLMFETQTQTRSSIPSGGMHVLVIAKRAGLQISVDEAFGSADSSAFGDSNAPNGTRKVSFDRLRKYTATAMGFPLKNSKVDPFLGVGLGILHTVGTEVVGTFTTPQAAAVAQERAVQAGSTGFISFLGGVQYKVSPHWVIYGQYQITNSPAAGNLLVGPTHAVTAGIRFSLGSAKEGLHGGGY
jgi:hypothetical protein